MKDILSPYQRVVEEEMQASIAALGPKNRLRDACEYALTNGGKRFRPALVLMMAKALRQNKDVVAPALAVEYFHTASLIADDLPSMDNDEFRRDKPSTHSMFGEAIALLATYALISAGYQMLAEFSKKTPVLGLLAVENVSLNTGILGAAGGQFFDLFPPDDSLETLLQTMHLKTVTLFEISFVLGWIFGGGEKLLLNEVKLAAKHFGMAFQIADDIADMEQDQASHNLALKMGRSYAEKMFHEEIKEFRALINKLGIDRSEFESLVSFLEASIQQ